MSNSSRDNLSTPTLTDHSSLPTLNPSSRSWEMETINNMASAAARAVWGDTPSSEEPVSGKTGDVSKGEPYDAGNIEHHENAPTTPAADGTATEPTTATNTTAEDTKPTPTPSANPPAAQGSSVTTSDSSHAQNDVRDPANPQTQPDKTAERENVDDSKPGPDKSDNPVKIDGPGPKPIAVVAKEHNGDAGNAGKDGVSSSGAGDSAGDDEEDGPQKESHGHGTGEQWVKTSGLQADGGDFDATKPGAGKEADRLMEEKGMHREDGSSNKSVPSSGSGGETKKPKLTDRIKAKLHKY